MAYQALYRVWRSQCFSDIVGQKTITTTLKNAIAQDKTSHAYLFCGPRGTGKTSAAKIFAKAINCPNQKDGEPCNTCDTCLSITNGKLNDVIEIDAASNNGVDEIRELRDKVKYAPTQATYKIYIIDEVHMLSTGAFNALLKTLEEPPERVIFILATTEPHKIPATIISRTQRFDFKKIERSEIVKHLKMILQKMEISFDERALYSIANAADGGMRDALSILDQALSLGNNQITESIALQVTGSLSLEKVVSFMHTLHLKQPNKSLLLLEEMLQEGKEPKRLIENLMQHYRDCLIYQQAPELIEQKNLEITEEFKQLCQLLTKEEIYANLSILNDTQQQLRFTEQGKIYLEVMTIKLSSEHQKTSFSDESSQKNKELEIALKKLEEKVEHLQQQLQQQKTFQKNTVIPEKNVKIKKETLPKEKVYTLLHHATKEHLQAVRHHWEDLLDLLSASQKAMLKACEPAAASKEGLLLIFDFEILAQRAMGDQRLKEAVQNALERLIEYKPELIALPKEVWPELRKTFLIEQKRKTTHSIQKIEEKKEAIVQTDIEVNEQHRVNQQTSFVKQAVELFGPTIVNVIDD